MKHEGRVTGSADDVGRVRGVERARPVAVEGTDHARVLEACGKRVEVVVADEAKRTVGRIGEQRQKALRPVVRPGASS